MELGHPVFDADNHYYEAEDAFTRYLDPALGPRCVQWAEIDGRRYHVVGGRVSRCLRMITGFRPFQGNSAQTVCFKVMNIEPVPVTSLQHEVPPALDMGQGCKMPVNSAPHHAVVKAALAALTAWVRDGVLGNGQLAA